MNAADAKTIFGEALRLKDAAERQAYVDRASEGNCALRQDVESLLRAFEQAGDFLGATRRVQASDFLVERTGVMIGRYKLLEKIGEGGFGVVYMAEQTEPVQRKVALKIIKPGMDSCQVIARFEAERQALALMEHPNIARVLDGGATAAGRPYFVMELVRGIPITDYCDQNKLCPVDRLQLFIRVCRAVQHAHHKGVIHRDLKPTNVLVTRHDGEPVPKIIDFGVAKALGQKLTERTLFTGFAQMLGTPAYMSPEQAELSGLDIDTRSDIYSLGVLLYELLTGVTPFDKETLGRAAFDEIRRLVREAEPARPSTRLQTLGGMLSEVAERRGTEPTGLARLLRGDLDWIVMRCLEKDRQRRYETADAVAADVERYLRREPVLAAGPDTLYIAGKFVRRHRTGLAMAGMLALLLAAGAVVSTWQAVRATRAERTQRQLRQRAEAGENKARIEAAKSQQVAQFLQDMLQGVGPSVARGRDTTMMREILDQTAARVARDLKDQPEVEAELLNALGWVYFELGEDQTAEKIHRDAYELKKRLRGSRHPEVAASLHGLGHALWRQGKLAEAEEVLREALALRKELGNEDLETARALNDLGLVLVSQGKPGEAESMAREALATRRKLLPEPDRDVAHSLNTLAGSLADQGKLSEAEARHREALAMRRRLFGDNHPDIAFSLGALGAVLAKEGRYAEAESLLRESLAMHRQLLTMNHADSLTPRYALAKLLVIEGKITEAGRLFGLPAARTREAVLNRIAWPLATCGHSPLRDGATAVCFAEEAVNATNRKEPVYLDTLAAAYAEVGQFEKAVSAQQEAIALYPDEKLKQAGASRLDLYESNRPYREHVLRLEF